MISKIKEEQMQLEMFPSAVRSLPMKKTWNENLSRSTRFPYEKIIISSIGFIITAVVFFSWGIEKGKNMVKVNIPSSVAPINTAPVNAPTKADMLIEKKGGPQIQPNPNTQKTLPAKIFPAKGTYTIQVATYRKTTHAQNAIDSLKNNGFKTFILPADKFVQLCVGKFSNQEEAKLVLKELRKTYADCFIRRI